MMWMHTCGADKLAVANIDMNDLEEIYRKIPHRPPFLWVDRIVSLDAESIVTEKDIPADLDVFQGHYPEHPIMPGVLLCEAVFQSGALLISDILRQQEGPITGVPVLTRIRGAKFKREVGPGDRIQIEAKISEVVGPAWFLKGKVSVDGKKAVTVEFACALKGEGESGK